MSEKPEALRLAENLVNQWWGLTASPSGLPEVSLVAVAALRVKAAAELRRQHAENERLKADNERLREALKKYGRHLDDCALTLGGYQCTCGFNQQEVPR